MFESNIGLRLDGLTGQESCAVLSQQLLECSFARLNRFSPQVFTVEFQ